MMTQDELLQLLRAELPKMLQGDPMFRAQVIGVLSEALVTKAELMQILEELRAMRADFERRFEAIDKRFDVVDKRFDVVDKRFDAVEDRLGGVEVGLGSLGLRLGRGLEDIIRQVIESYSGIGPLRAERLILVDETGEFRHVGATIEFDALVTNGRKFLVEVKNYAKSEEVWTFYQKARFAETKLGETFEKILIAPAATQSAVALAKQLGILCHTFSVGE